MHFKWVVAIFERQNKKSDFIYSTRKTLVCDDEYKKSHILIINFGDLSAKWIYK